MILGILLKDLVFDYTTNSLTHDTIRIDLPP